MTSILKVLYLCLALLGSNVSAAPSQTVEDYGKLPSFRSLSISPNGDLFSYIARGDGHDLLAVRRTITKEIIFVAKITAFNARSTAFLTDDIVLLRGSGRHQPWGYTRAHERSGVLAYSIKKKKFVVLLKGTEGLHVAQGGVGKIVGLDEEKGIVYMPAYGYGLSRSLASRHPATRSAQTGSSAVLNLYAVNLETGKGRLYAKGSKDTVDWFMGEQGKVLAREEYNNSTDTHSIQSKLSGEWTTVYSNETKIPEIFISGVSTDGQSLMLVDSKGDSQALFALDLSNGQLSQPLYTRENGGIDHLILDNNRKLKAVVYSGFKPTYEFVDPKLTKMLERLSRAFPGSSVNYQSITNDNNQIIVLVSGNEGAGAYYLFDNRKGGATLLATQYDPQEIKPVKAFWYNARDGLKIPALLTLPSAQTEPVNLPLIVLPHGGPEAYDQVSFHWMAQFFAVKGYAVLQPNFRGSSGFGYAHRDAGRGRWGKEMQEDVSDGVAALVSEGQVDPNRVCIIGGSYGGYSALAGGAFSPELYRCVVSINGLSDLPKMLRSKKYNYGGGHWVVSYWEKIIGNLDTEIEKLKSISPVNFASNFNSAVLLIHGREDTVISIAQSHTMRNALEKANKSVEYLVLDGEDHWLSKSTTRLQMLGAIETFLDTYNPAKIESVKPKQRH